MIGCSIIIPAYNHASLTRACINELLAHPPAHTTQEIIVVDDASRDLTARMLASYGDRIKVVTHLANAGFAVTCNDGALAAAGEFLLFLNNDTLPRPGWLDALIAAAQAHPEAGIFGSKLIFPNDTIQHAGVVFAANGFPLHIYYGFPADLPAVNVPRAYQAVTGACLMIRRDLFERLGGFDTTYHNVYEDVDLCLRAGELGAQVRYVPESVVVHLQSLTRGVVKEGEARPKDPFLDPTRSSAYFGLRWASKVRRDEMPYYFEDGLLDYSLNSMYPRSFVMSPLLGVFESDDAVTMQANKLLQTRAKQVEELLEETIRLRMRVQELELELLWAGSGAGPNNSAPDPSGPLPLSWAQRRGATGFFETRAWIAALYLDGDGIEIGALHSPMRTPPTARVRYVDRLPVAELRRQYPELDRHPLVEPDIIADGERLEPIPDESQDFVIASHFLEHCQDPIGALGHMLRVTKPGGIVFLGIPDKRFTFDRRRPVTPFAHLVRDHVEGAHLSRAAHFEEWSTLAEDENIKGRSAQELMDFDYSIHFHVWTQAELLELFGRLVMDHGFRYDVEAIVKNGMELIAVLRKASD